MDTPGCRIGTRGPARRTRVSRVTLVVEVRRCVMESGPNGHGEEQACTNGCRCCCPCGTATDPTTSPRRSAPPCIDQTRRPDHVVVVRDGPVAPALARTLAELADTSPVPVDVLELDRNVGLGPALDAGLAACRHDVVRADGRRRHQPAAPLRRPDADRRGGGGPRRVRAARVRRGRRRRRRPPRSRRPTPTTSAPASRFADPFNHPTVVYRRGLRAGRRRLRRLRADGGLPALGEDDPRGGAGGERRRAAGALPGRRRRVPAPRRARPSCAPSSGCSAGCTRWASRRAPVPRNVVVRGGYRLVPEGVRSVAYRRLVAPYGERGRAQCATVGQVHLKCDDGCGAGLHDRGYPAELSGESG